MRTFKQWSLITTKQFEAKLYYEMEDLFVFGLTIILSHDGSAIRRRGVYISLFGFTLQMYKPQ